MEIYSQLTFQLEWIRCAHYELVLLAESLAKWAALGTILARSQIPFWCGKRVHRNPTTFFVFIIISCLSCSFSAAKCSFISSDTRTQICAHKCTVYLQCTTHHNRFRPTFPMTFNLLPIFRRTSFEL